MDNSTVEYPSTQEVFDTLVAVPAAIEVLYEDFEKVTTKHMPDLRTVGKTDAFFDDVLAVAEKHGLSFTHPKFNKGMTVVPTRPTVH